MRLLIRTVIAIVAALVLVPIEPGLVELGPVGPVRFVGEPLCIECQRVH